MKWLFSYRIIEPIGFVVLCTAVFATALFYPLSREFLDSVFSYFRVPFFWLTGCFLLASVTGTLLRPWIQIIGVFGLFGVGLSAHWHHLVCHGSTVGSLLPLGDACNYYIEARTVQEGFPIGLTARRPLQSLMLSVALALTGQNLQLTIALFVAVNALCCLMLARAVYRTHGFFSAAVAAVLVYFYYRYDGGMSTTLSENTGLALGVIGVANIWHGGAQKSRSTVLLGIVLLTLGLCARAGAFFVLPALVLAYAIGTRGDSKFSFRGFLHASGAVGVGFAINSLLIQLLTAPGTAAFSNFAQTLYGVVVGGKGWGQSLIDHPTVPEGYPLYVLAWKAFLAEPLNLVRGCVRMLEQYIMPNPNHAFSFVALDFYQSSIQMACFALTALGLAVCALRARDLHFLLLFAAGIGHFASIPFAPPVDAGGRIYAATIPVLAILVAVPLGEFLQRSWAGVTRLAMPLVISLGFSSEHPRPTRKTHDMIWIVGFGSLLVTTVGPLVIYFTASDIELGEPNCPSHLEGSFIRLTPGSMINLIDDNSTAPDFLPATRVKYVYQIPPICRVDGLAPWCAAGQVMFNGYDLKNKRALWLIAPSSLIPTSYGIVSVCGRRVTEEPNAKMAGVFFADAIVPLGSSSPQ